MATALRCPACSSSDLGMDSEGRLACLACGAALGPLRVPCRACGQANASDQARCAACGAPLSIAHQVFDRADRPAAAAWLDRTRAQAPGLQQAGARASRQRLQALLSIDLAREQAQRREQQARQARDRSLVRAAAIALAAFASLLALGLLLSLL